MALKRAVLGGPEKGHFASQAYCDVVVHGLGGVFNCDGGVDVADLVVVGTCNSPVGGGTGTVLWVLQTGSHT